MKHGWTIRDTSISLIRKENVWKKLTLHNIEGINIPRFVASAEEHLVSSNSS
jgi:hypothetical protein